MPKQKEQQSSPFWKPAKKGDSVQGRFMFFRQTIMNKGTKKEQTGVALVLDHCQVGLGAGLKNIFAPVYTKLKQGDKLKITFGGIKKLKGGNKFKLFDVWRNGTKLEPAKVFSSVPASKKQLSNFFSE